MSVTNEFDFIVQWHLTERCNLRCRHCYQGNTVHGELSSEELQTALAEVIETLETWGSLYDITFLPSFSITGGEPLLSPDFFNVLETLAACGYEISVLSNGTLVTDEHAGRLAEIGVRGVQVSVEGPKEAHDAIRGAGSFNAALHGARRLAEHGIAVTLNATLSRENGERFFDLAEIARRAGARRLGFARLVPSGRGAAMMDSMLSKEELQDLYGRICSLDLDNIDLVSGDPVFSQLRTGKIPEDLGSIACGGCSAGVSGVTILADGTMVPCRRLNVPLGNIVRDSLREVWADSPVLNKLRDRDEYPGKCGSCRHWAVCRGCRAVAYETHGDICADDPQCFLRESVSSP